MGMINYDTILSAYDDKLTLMQWLKKVEKALNEAAATSFKVNKKGNATISFSIVFEDGSEIESGDIVLQQGESVAAGRIENSHLILTLTNGEELDAGNLFNGNVNIVGDVAITGDLSAGNITGNSIIENMEGYGFSSGAVDVNVAVENIYAGAVKNGNELTLVLFGKITRTGTSVNGWIQAGIFTLPKAVADKIITTSIGFVANAVNSAVVQLFNSNSSYKTVPSVSRKRSDTDIDIILYNINDLALNVEYQFRSQITFLLSDNLAA